MDEGIGLWSESVEQLHYAHRPAGDRTGEAEGSAKGDGSSGFSLRQLVLLELALKMFPPCCQYSEL